MILLFFGIAIAILFLYVIYDLSVCTTLPNLDNKHVLVVGGSSGIGKAVAVEAAANGANVTIIARDPEKLKRACDEITLNMKSPKTQKVSSVIMDVTQSLEATEAAISGIEDKSGPIYLIAICAGKAVCRTFENDTEANIRRLIDLNLVGTMLVTNAVAKKMMKREKGYIIITSSLGALLGIYGMGAYCASKWALRGFAESLQQEVAGHNIHVTLLLPPDTDTPGYEEENIDKPDETKMILESGGLSKPEDVARKALSDTFMGGDHHHHKFPKMPDWRCYKIEDVPELMRTKRALASLGLKDNWLRNEVWRYDTKAFGTRKERIMTFLFRGFKWGLLATIVTVGIEKALSSGGHGHDEHAHSEHH